MSAPIVLGALGLAIAAALGAGAAVLRGLGVLAKLEPRDRLAWSFALGFGVVGWGVLWLGMAGALTVPALATVLVLAAAGGWTARRELAAAVAAVRTMARPSAAEWAVLAAAAVLAAGDLLEGLAPPVDADTLAYHFALPRDFLRAGALTFTPRVVDGAIPLLVHGTYVAPLALGGERALTLWTMVSGWAAAGLVFTVARPYMPRPWALAAAVVFLGTPAVLYGGGSGQVEVRLALFALVGAFAAAEAVRRADAGWAAVAGLAAGFYAGGKYLGLLFVGAVGLALVVAALSGGRRWRPVFTFSAAAALAGCQGYLWNAWNIGDPVFPMLFPVIGVSEPGWWDAAHDAAFRRQFFGSELPFARTLAGLVSYPFAVLLDPPPAVEAGRVGFGPFVLLVLPFAVAGLRRLDRRLWFVLAVAAIFYAVWYLSGSSQRVRHLLPVYPLLLVVATAGARGWATTRRRIWPVAAAVAATLLVQSGGQAVFAAAYGRYQTSGDDRDSFIARNVPLADPVSWLNRHLADDAVVVHSIRQYDYLLRPRTYFAHPFFQARVDLLPGHGSVPRLSAQLAELGATHFVVLPAVSVPPEEHGAITRLAAGLIAAGCADPVRAFPADHFVSRTLAPSGSDQRFPTTVGLLRLDLGSVRCRAGTAR